MANRSHLYSTNKIPTKKFDPDVVTGLSEFNYDIPLVYKILLTSRPQKCFSIIWDNQEIGIAGEYKNGVDKLAKFLNLLEEENINNKEEYQKYHKEALDFLNKESNKDNFILLEAGEIFDISGVPLDEAVNDLVNEINLISKELDYLFNLKEKPKKWYSIFSNGILSKSNIEVFRKLKLNWKENFGIDCWSNVLYYDFPKKRKNKK